MGEPFISARAKPNYQIRVPGALSVLTGLGIQLAPYGGTISSLIARRATPGISGTTTVSLEVNGAVLSPAVTLSWASTDGAFALKSTTFPPVRVAAGDRISLRVTACELSAQDIYAVVS